MQKKFITNLGFLIFLNLLIKPFWVLGIGIEVQNVVGPESYGIYFTMLNFSFLFHIFLDFGINNFQNRNISQNPDQASKLLSSLALVKLGFGALFMTLVYTVGKFVMEYSEYYMYILLLVGLNQVLLSLVLFLRANLAGLHYFKSDSIISVLDRLLMIAICGVLLWGDVTEREFQIEWFVYAQTAAYILTIGTALVLLLWRAKLAIGKPNLKELPEVIKKSLPFALLTLIMGIYYRVDVIMIEELLQDGAMQAGIYAQAYRIPEMGNMFALLFATLLLPLFSRMISEKEDVRELMSLSFRLLVTPAIIAAVIFSYFSLDIVRIAFSEQFEDTAAVQVVLMYTFIPLASTYVFGTLLTANGDLKTLNIISIFGLIVNVGLNLILIPGFGIYGAAVATLVTQSSVLFMQLGYVGYQFKVRPSWSLVISLIVFVSGLLGFNYVIYGFDWDHKLMLVVVAVFAGFWALISQLIPLKGIYKVLKYGK